MNRLQTILAACSAATLSSCAGVLPPMYTPIAIIGPVDDYEAIGDVLTAQDGDIIFRQKIVAGEMARLVKGIELQDDALKNRKISVPDGSLLQPMLVTATGINGMAWCTIELTTEHDSMLGEKFSGRTCFVDRDKSGEFDTLLQGPGVWNSFIERNEFKIQSQGFKRETTIDGPPIEVSLPYELTKENAPVEGDIFMFYYARGEGGGRFKPYFEVNGDRGDLAGGNSLFEPPYPQTISVYNVEIEVISVDDKVLTYRILKGMPEGRAITTDLGY